MDVVTFGETMILLTSEERLRYSENFSKKIGGAESNVAIGLARLGHKVGWFSRLGNEEFGKTILSYIRGEGVDVSRVILDSKAQTAIYFKELRSPNLVKVQYYRKNSAASRLSKDDLDEDYISQAKYLHISGITPALSASCYEATIEAISIAKRNGVKVVFDPNLRKKLWSEEKAREVLTEIALLSDYFLPGLQEGVFLTGKSNPQEIANFFTQKGVKNIIIKAGALGAYYVTSEKINLVRGFKVDQVVDPVGAGDGFVAGFLSGLIDGLPIEQAVERGNATGAMVIMSNGDVEGLPDREEYELFMEDLIEDVVR